MQDSSLSIACNKTENLLYVKCPLPLFYSFLILQFLTPPSAAGSYSDQCLSKSGVMYERDDGSNGCYYYYARENAREYNYTKSKEFCENINGSLPIIKGPHDNENMLQLLKGYVSLFVYVQGKW